ncbi:MAG: CHAT domain-containing protein [Raineya sp.]|jgi:CHAT domain-containing protein|nr:CHAT domain-containing protein [Raineya sp.]
MKSFFLTCLFFVIIFDSSSQSAKETYFKAFELQERALYKEAKSYFEESAKGFEQNKDYENYLQAKTDLSYNLLKINLLKESIDLSEKNIQEAAKFSSKLDFWKAKNQKNIAESYLILGNSDNSKNILKQSINQLEQLNYPDVLAESYSLLGIIYWQEGNNNLALEYLEKGLDLRQKNNLADIAASYNDLGLVYQNIDPKKSLEFYQQAFDVYRTKYTSIHPKNAVLFTNIGLVQKSEKKYALAQENFEKAQNIWKSLYPNGHPNEAFVISNIGRIFLEKKQYNTANNYFQKSLAIYESVYKSKHPEIANTYNLIAKTYFESGEPKNALENVQKAFINNSNTFNSTNIRHSPSIQEIISYTTFLYTLTLKAESLEQLYTTQTVRLSDLKTAIYNINIADTLINRIRQNATSKADKIQLGQISAELYERGVRLCHLMAIESKQKKKYNEQAFYFSEKAKSVVLLEAISDSKAKSYGNIPQEILKEEEELRLKITFLEQQIAQKPSENILIEYKNQLFELNRQYDAFQKKLEKDFPDYFNLKYSSKSISIEDMRSVLDNKTAIISYMVGDHHIYIFTLTKTKLELQSINKPEGFEDNITFFLNTIRFSAYKSFVKMGYKIYSEIFPKNLSSKIENLVIIQDGKLGVLPMESLVTKKLTLNDEVNFSNLPYLISKKSLSYSYSATLWYQNLTKSNSATNQGIALIAPIEFEGNIATLPGTEQEVNEIAAICRLKNFKVNTLIKKEAQEKLIKALNLSDFSVLHFATHGLVDQESPDLSQVFLGKSEQEDGNLFAGEIYNLRLNADLVTLSACEVGLGKLTKGEGLIGLSRAFLYAGAKNLVVSLWKVSDESTARLMINFYTNHLANKQITYGQAMREAKLSLIQDKKYAKPYYWAAFIVLGK